MRSIRGLVAAVIVLLTVPVAIGVALATGGGAEPSHPLRDRRGHAAPRRGRVRLRATSLDRVVRRSDRRRLRVDIFVLQGIADAIGEPKSVAFRLLWSSVSSPSVCCRS